MKGIKTIIFSIIGLSLMAFSQCSNGQRLEKKAPLEFGEVYFKKRAQAIKDLVPVVTLYIPIEEENKNVELDSVYFKGKSAKLVKSAQNQNLYLGRFTMNSKHTEDIILSSDMNEEHKNKLPQTEPKIPFELKPNECVISFKQAEETRYYKISNIKEKRLDEVPMVPRHKP